MRSHLVRQAVCGSTLGTAHTHQLQTVTPATHEQNRQPPMPADRGHRLGAVPVDDVVDVGLQWVREPDDLPRARNGEAAW
jgi:hypothetical protein